MKPSPTTAPPAAAPTTPRALVILDPRDDSFVGSVEPASPEATHAALGLARAAATAWQRTSAADRAGLVRRAASVLSTHAGELARLNERETGRPAAEAEAGVAAGVAAMRQYAELGPLHGGRRLAGAWAAIDYTATEPRGVAAVITPWNDAVAVPAGLIAAALVTGNTVIHKPSERCPHLGLRLGELLGPVFPDGVLATLAGGPAVGAMLAGHQAVDVVAHVGSTAAGKAIGRLASYSGAHVIRENGGKDPLLVDAGVDPGWAASQAALGAFANSGQLCTSVERVYLHRSVADAFLAELARRATGLNAAGAVAPLVDRRLRDSVAAQVSGAIAAGATCLAGGSVPPGPGAWYPATVLSGCDHEMAVMTEETFGPVAPVMVVDSFADGLARAADSRYGLAATVLTPNPANAQAAAAGLDVGTVKINAVFGGAPGGSAQPRGDSGAGFGYGPGLLAEFTRTKVVHWAPPGSDRP